MVLDHIISAVLAHILSLLLSNRKIFFPTRSLRDPKHPTIGPVELNIPGTGDQVLYRYVYDGVQPMVRETYRYTRDGKPGGPFWFDQADVTRTVPLNPGGSGPVYLVDSDGTVDVSFPRRDGTPWFMYRALEGELVRPQGDYEDRLIRADRHFESSEGQWMSRNTGILFPSPLPPHVLLDLQQWHSYVLEPDLVAGRRGMLGWNGRGCDEGLVIIYAPPSIPPSAPRKRDPPPRPRKSGSPSEPHEPLATVNLVVRTGENTPEHRIIRPETDTVDRPFISKAGITTGNMPAARAQLRGRPENEVNEAVYPWTGPS